MEEKKTPTKTVIKYYIGVFITMILLNALFFPLITEKKITKVDYGTFIMKIDSGLVKTVSIQDEEILFTQQKKIKNESGRSSVPGDQLFMMLQERDENELTYSTVPMNDPELVERLMKASS